MKLVECIKQATKQEPSIRTVAQVPIDGVMTQVEIISFNNLSDTGEHIAVCFGDWKNQTHPLVRIHSECLTGDVLGSCKCDCGPQLKEAINKVSQQSGIILYLRQEGRGIGLYKKLEAYVLQEQGFNTYEANLRLGFKKDQRDYNVAAEMLRALKVSSVRLLSNNPDKKIQLMRTGIEVVESVPTTTFINPNNKAYLQTKQQETQHTLNL